MSWYMSLGVMNYVLILFAVLVRLNRNLVTVSYRIQPDVCHTFPTLLGLFFFRRFSSYLHYHLFLPDHSLSGSLHPFSPVSALFNLAPGDSKEDQVWSWQYQAKLFVSLCYVLCCTRHIFVLFLCDITPYIAVSLLYLCAGFHRLKCSAPWALSTFYAHRLFSLHISYVSA